MNDIIYPASAIAVITLVTFLLRALPFLVFGKRKLPKAVRYLGKVLPPAIMTVLVVYCLRNTDLSSAPFGLPEMVSVVLVILLQCIKKNMYLSVVAGTVCYMIAIRLF